MRLGSVRFRLAPGTTKVVKVRLSRARARAVRRLRRATVRITISGRDAAGRAKTTRLRLKLRAGSRRVP